MSVKDRNGSIERPETLDLRSNDELGSLRGSLTKIINEEVKTHFDPTVVAAFNKVARDVYDLMQAEEANKKEQ